MSTATKLYNSHLNNITNLCDAGVQFSFNHGKLMGNLHLEMLRFAAKSPETAREVAEIMFPSAHASHPFSKFHEILHEFAKQNLQQPAYKMMDRCDGKGKCMCILRLGITKLRNKNVPKIEYLPFR